MIQKLLNGAVLALLLGSISACALTVDRDAPRRETTTTTTAPVVQERHTTTTTETFHHDD